MNTPSGDVPAVKTYLSFGDILRALRVRLGIGRMSYRIKPGLYAAGNPSAESPVLVTANYKLSFDHVRRHLSGIDAWIIVLDTKGINVWCAAGKGTFGTQELIRRVRAVRIGKCVSHRTLILPQLGAVGVCAHEVKRMSGFTVKYGPVNARDIPAYLSAGMKKTEDMSRVRFGFIDRCVLIPVEFMLAWKGIAAAAAAAYLCDALARRGLPSVFSPDAAILLSGVLAGTVLVPAFLPYLPFRAFSIKGAAAGLFVSAASALLFPAHPVIVICRTILVCALAAFFALQFTGATTFTSEAGVRKEMRVAVPVIAAAGAASLAGRLVSAVWMGQ
ncbi:MAG: mercury methylation corrinoid protein HgcA [Spirochaetota bacterium]